MTMPRIAMRLNHVAYPTFDTAATVRFYTDVMGFRLVDAVRDERGPKPFLHTFFAMESGEVIAFFDIPGLEKPKRDHLPPWVRHFAMSVDSMETLMAWKTRLESNGLHVTGPVNHDGVWQSIYFQDPNEVTLELTYQARELTDADAASAAAMVAEWTAPPRV